MKMNNVQRIRRTFVCLVILFSVVISTGFDVQPAQASPPALDNYILNLDFDGPGKICEDTPRHIIAQVSVAQVKPHEAIPIRPLNGSIQVSATVGSITPAKQVIEKLWYGKPQKYTFVYTPVKAGPVTLNWDALVPGVGQVQQPLKFDVKKKFECRETLNIHGSANLNQVLGSMMAGGPWQPVAIYDISGMIQVDENGDLRGEGTANNFLDILWTGQGFENITCSVSGPREGQSAVELEADPNAWAQDGEIDLQFNIQSMQVNSITLSCCIDGKCNSHPLPGFTIASFDLDFDPLSAQGGATDLDFHFPAAHVPLKMQLIVSPEEAGS